MIVFRDFDNAAKGRNNRFRVRLADLLLLKARLLHELGRNAVGT